jgi:hypothetical protein
MATYHQAKAGLVRQDLTSWTVLHDPFGEFATSRLFSCETLAKVWLDSQPEEYRRDCQINPPRFGDEVTQSERNALFNRCSVITVSKDWTESGRQFWRYHVGDECGSGFAHGEFKTRRETMAHCRKEYPHFTIWREFGLRQWFKESAQ